MLAEILALGELGRRAAASAGGAALATWKTMTPPSPPKHLPVTALPPPISFLASAITFAGTLVMETISFPSAPFGTKAKNIFFDLACLRPAVSSASGMAISPKTKRGLQYNKNANSLGAQTERLDPARPVRTLLGDRNSPADFVHAARNGCSEQSGRFARHHINIAENQRNWT
jgi:hypothetical protein